MFKINVSEKNPAASGCPALSGPPVMTTFPRCDFSSSLLGAVERAQLASSHWLYAPVIPRTTEAPYGLRWGSRWLARPRLSPGARDQVSCRDASTSLFLERATLNHRGQTKVQFTLPLKETRPVLCFFCLSLQLWERQEPLMWHSHSDPTLVHHASLPSFSFHEKPFALLHPCFAHSQAS